MKKGLLIIGVIAAFSFASCKKDRTCTCTTTSGGVVGDPDVTVYTKVNKHDARQNCVGYTSTGTYGGVTTTTSKVCELK